MLILTNPHHFLTMCIWDCTQRECKTIVEQHTKMFAWMGKTSRADSSVVLRHGGICSKLRRAELNLQTFKSEVCSQIVLKCFYLARIGRPDIQWSVNKLARAVKKSHCPWPFWLKPFLLKRWVVCAKRLSQPLERRSRGGRSVEESVGQGGERGQAPSTGNSDCSSRATYREGEEEIGGGRHENPKSRRGVATGRIGESCGHPGHRRCRGISAAPQRSEFNSPGTVSTTGQFVRSAAVAGR